MIAVLTEYVRMLVATVGLGGLVLVVVLDIGNVLADCASRALGPATENDAC